MIRHTQFDDLHLTLLQGGIPPRAAMRTADELREHHADLKNELVQDGMDPHVAERAALERLGDISVIAAAVLAADPRRALVWSHPALAFILMPLVMFAIATGLIGLAAYGLYVAATECCGLPVTDPALSIGLRGTLLAIAYGSAPVAAIACCEAGGRQRCRLIWMLVSCVVLGVLAASFRLGCALPIGGAGTGRVQLMFSSALDPVRLALPMLTLPVWLLTNKLRRSVGTGAVLNWRSS